LTLTSSQ